MTGQPESYVAAKNEVRPGKFTTELGGPTKIDPIEDTETKDRIDLRLCEASPTKIDPIEDTETNPPTMPTQVGARVPPRSIR